MAAPPSSSAPLDPQPTNGSSLSISHFLSSTPISSPSLSQPSPDPDAQVTAEEDDARLAAAAARGARRSSLQAPGLVQLGGTAFAPTEGAIPGSPDDSPSLGGGVTSLGARGARGEGGEQIGKGEAVLIEFLLVSGKRMRRRIGVESTVREVREGVWRSWPEEWRGQEELPPSADALRLLYLGKFLEDRQTLSSYGLGASTTTTTGAGGGGEGKTDTAEGAPTIIHLNIRPLATEVEYQSEPLKPQKSGACGCCIVS